MLIASPWSRGGKVCSQVFDHTSTLQFLETFVNKKYGKNMRFDNINAWRRTICGDLTSAFAPFNPKDEKLPFLDRNQFVETIYNAKFKEEPGNFKAVSNADIQSATKAGSYAGLMSQQEPGKRRSCALPYQLSAGGNLEADKSRFSIRMKADQAIFGNNAAGSPFTVYAPVAYTDDKGKKELCRNWAFAVKAGDELSYQWPLKAFDNGLYQLRVHGPNGFYREFMGTAKDPQLQVDVEPELKRLTKQATGNAKITVQNQGNKPARIAFNDIGYKKQKAFTKEIAANSKEEFTIPLGDTYGWYDFTITSPDQADFKQHFAGRIETGKESFTDPLINKV